MGNKHIFSFLHKYSRRYIHSIAMNRQSDFRASLLNKLNVKILEEGDQVCIYRVPAKMRQVEIKAYDPSIISIGPYHYGDNRYKEMEKYKLRYYQKLFRPKSENGVHVDQLIEAIEKLEPQARSCYAGNVEMSRDRFIEMMILDGCFIVQLLKESMHPKFVHNSSLISRWMLPTLRRDLIMLENQLPLFILLKIFNLTVEESSDSSRFEELAFRFFHPLLQRDSKEQNFVRDASSAAETLGHHHFLDLFRSRILPEIHERKKQDYMIQSITELNEAGVFIEKAENHRPLDVKSKGRVLQIPPLFIEDYRGTLFRNMVAFEQCHKHCNPDVTAYLFFFDGLINSEDDVELLRYNGVLHHSLGSDKDAVNLVNKICKEVDWNGEESYLHKLVCEDIDLYFKSGYAKVRAKLVHYYFRNWVVGISTAAAFLALYLTLIQTGCGMADSSSHFEKKSFWSYLYTSFSILFSAPSSSPSNQSKVVEDDMP